MKNPWKTLKSKVVYQNPWIKVREDQVIQPDNKPGIYAVVEPREKSIAIVPYDGEYVYLVGQFRYTHNEYCWEIPAGGAHEHESFDDAAKRELLEETGLVTGKLTKISLFYPSKGISNEVLHLFLAENLQQKKSHPDATEEITVRKIRLEEAIRMIETFEIKDVASIVALQYLHLQLLSKKI